jgi:hypothetical protein
VLLRGEGTQSRVDIVVGGGIGVVGVAIMLLLDEEMVVIPKNYWKLMLLVEVLLFLLLSGYCGITNDDEVIQQSTSVEGLSSILLYILLYSYQHQRNHRPPITLLRPLPTINTTIPTILDISINPLTHHHHHVGLLFHPVGPCGHCQPRG